MQDETYDHIALGILETNSSSPLEVFVDHWQPLTTGSLPGGTDKRPSTTLQEQNYRSEQGVQWQIDWTTWKQDLRLDPQFGLYAAGGRLQSGRNLDRMPDLTNGWAEIMIAWPQGSPPRQPDGYFGPMVGFRKEINREQNLEVIPIGSGDGKVDLALETWIGQPVMLARWPLPEASIGTGSHIPEPDDIIRVKWQQVSPALLAIQASYYDASTGSWHRNVISGLYDVTAITVDSTLVDYTDVFHTKSSVTIDSIYYSIQRYTVGTIDTFPLNE